MFEFISNIDSNLNKPFEQRVADLEDWHKEEVNRLREKHLRRVAEMEKRGRNGEMNPELQRHMMEHQRFMNEHEQVHLLNALNF